MCSDPLIMHGVEEVQLDHDCYVLSKHSIYSASAKISYHHLSQPRNLDNLKDFYLTMDFVVFLSLTAILFNVLSASSLPSKDHDITRRNVASSILPASLLGPSVSASEALFREANANKRWAKMLLKIDNFSTWRLEHLTYKASKLFYLLDLLQILHSYLARGRKHYIFKFKIK